MRHKIVTRTAETGLLVTIAAFASEVQRDLCLQYLNSIRDPSLSKLTTPEAVDAKTALLKKGATP